MRQNRIERSRLDYIDAKLGLSDIFKQLTELKDNHEKEQQENS